MSGRRSPPGAPLDAPALPLPLTGRGSGRGSAAPSPAPGPKAGCRLTPPKLRSRKPRRSPRRADAAQTQLGRPLPPSPPLALRGRRPRVSGRRPRPGAPLDAPALSLPLTGGGSGRGSAAPITCARRESRTPPDTPEFRPRKPRRSPRRADAGEPQLRPAVAAAATPLSSGEKASVRGRRSPPGAPLDAPALPFPLTGRGSGWGPPPASRPRPDAPPTCLCPTAPLRLAPCVSCFSVMSSAAAGAPPWPSGCPACAPTGGSISSSSTARTPPPVPACRPTTRRASSPPGPIA